MAIQRSGCHTYQDLIKLLRSCYKQSGGETTEEGARVQYAETEQVFAIREWLIPCMKPMHALLDFHHFRLTRNKDGKCEIDYMEWCEGEKTYHLC